MVSHHVHFSATEPFRFYPRRNSLIIFQDLRERYANLIFDTVEEYAPGFKASIVGKEVLSPPDLEATFGLTGGNIFHGSMSLDQGRGYRVAVMLWLLARIFSNIVYRCSISLILLTQHVFSFKADLFKM